MTTQNDLDLLALRIERAYHRRHPLWQATGVTPGVWNAAAVRLNEAVIDRPSLPTDPELFVAVQDYHSFRRDPWCELAQEGSAGAYRLAVGTIIRQLKVELRSELRWSRRLLASGRSLDELMARVKSRVSPIAKLALCHHLARPDLAEAIRPAAEAQHLACPLYRFACKKLMPGSAYPEPLVGAIGSRHVAPQDSSFAWN